MIDKSPFDILPTPIKGEVAKFLTIRDICMLERTSRSNKLFFSHDDIWKIFVREKNENILDTNKQIATHLANQVFTIISPYLPQIKLAKDTSIFSKVQAMFFKTKTELSNLIYDHRDRHIAQSLRDFMLSTAKLEKDDLARFFINHIGMFHNKKPLIEFFLETPDLEKERKLPDVYNRLIQLLCVQFEIVEQDISDAANNNSIEIAPNHINIALVFSNILEEKLSSMQLLNS